mmetsp:Transcript_18390/g.23861  ORF Transcript_18390/g.23861 Transcript_18390/m.23861 type:complete len:412 (+) Transcript_18390:55-1290(+)
MSIDTNTNSSSRNDRIIIDVGGTQFVSSKSTLSTNSSYFQALLSQTWTHETETETETNKNFDFFVDQNPNAFKVLLDFMRKGCIEVEQLTSDVLLQAEFLGMEDLIRAVKCRSYRNYFVFESCVSDDETVVLFDERLGTSIMKLVTTGFLPRYLVDSVHKDETSSSDTVEKEFAVILLQMTTDDKFGASFSAQFNGSHRSHRWPSSDAVADYATKITECLTILHRHRYATVEECELVANDNIPMGLKSLGRIVLSRKSDGQRNVNREEEAAMTVASNSIQCLIIDCNSTEYLYNDNRSRSSVKRKEFAAVRFDDRTVVSEKTFGSASRMLNENNADCHSTWYLSLTPFVLNWLHKNKFYHREVEFENIISKFFNVKLYSRLVESNGFLGITNPSNDAPNDVPPNNIEQNPN